MQEAKRALEELSQDSRIEYIEEDGKVYPTQYYLRGDHHRRLKQTTPYGIPMVQADLAATGTKKKKICIIDTGYDLGHQDLPTADVMGDPPSWAPFPWNIDPHGHGKYLFHIHFIDCFSFSLTLPNLRHSCCRHYCCPGQQQGCDRCHRWTRTTLYRTSLWSYWRLVLLLNPCQCCL